MGNDNSNILGCDKVDFNLIRFVAAQSIVYETALDEIRQRRKLTHWMWFIFPQMKGLGTSEMAVHYSIHGIKEAKAYLAHPQLGTRLIECTLAMCDGPETDAQEILGEIDAAKFRSCMTLFELANGQEPCFANALEKFFGGVRDERTILALAG